MNRRDILLGLAGAAVVAEELLVPQRSIFLPPRAGWLVLPWDRKWPYGARGLVVNGWRFTYPERPGGMNIEPSQSSLPWQAQPLVHDGVIMEPWDKAPVPTCVAWQEKGGTCWYVDREFQKREITQRRFDALLRGAQTI